MKQWNLHNFNSHKDFDRILADEKFHLRLKLYRVMRRRFSWILSTFMCVFAFSATLYDKNFIKSAVATAYMNNSAQRWKPTWENCFEKDLRHFEVDLKIKIFLKCLNQGQSTLNLQLKTVIVVYQNFKCPHLVLPISDSAFKSQEEKIIVHRSLR